MKYDMELVRLYYINQARMPWNQKWQKWDDVSDQDKELFALTLGCHKRDPLVKLVNRIECWMTSHRYVTYDYKYLRYDAGTDVHKFCTHCGAKHIEEIR